MKIASRATPEGLAGHSLSTTALKHAAHGYAFQIQPCAYRWNGLQGCGLL